MPKYMFIVGDYGYELPKPTVAGVDNGNGTATITVGNTGGERSVTLSYGTTSSANDEIVEMVDGKYTIPVVDTNTEWHFKAQLVGADGSLSDWSTKGTVTVTLLDAATPEADPAAGGIPVGTMITLSCDSEGAAIFYTLNGDTPDGDSTEYDEPIEFESAMTIKAIAYAVGFNPSSVLEASYTVALAAKPVADPVGGEFTDDVAVTLTSATDGATIYYTLDGGEPTDDSTEYDDEITLTETKTVKAIAYAETYEPSEVLTEEYTINKT